MLSRVAERVYWMARYLERTENTARLINVHTALLLDLPGKMEINWFTLIRLFKLEGSYHVEYDSLTEDNIMRFLIADLDNSSSLASSLANMRENVRTSLDVLPEETWEQVNQAYILMGHAERSISSRHARQNLLRSLLRSCQGIGGVMDSHLSRDHTYDFMQIGMLLERADMTSRILEMASLLLADDRSDTLRQYEGILWANLLQALSGRQMYQLHVSPRIKGEKVLEFLVSDPTFPRSLQFSLQSVGEYLQHLPNHAAARDIQVHLLEYLQHNNIAAMPNNQVHLLMDYLQGQFALLHTEISNTWFYPNRNEQLQKDFS